VGVNSPGEQALIDPPRTARTRLESLPGGSAAALGLPGHWYVVCPAVRVSHAASEPFAVCGFHIGLRRNPDRTITCTEIRRPVGGVPEATPLIVKECAPGGTLPWVEKDGYVWAYLGRDASPHPPPALEPLHDGDMVFETRTIPVRADWRLVLENSLDFAHSAILHSWSSPIWLMHRFSRQWIVEARYQRTADGLTVDGLLGRRTLFRHSFHLPDRMRLTLLPDKSRPMDVVVHHVPEGPGVSRMEILAGRRRAPWEPRHSPERPIRFREGALRLHRQDVEICELQQRVWERLRPDPERHCAADAYTLLLRRVLEDAAAGKPWLASAEERVRQVHLRV